jgi:hypothetical protein
MWKTKGSSGAFKFTAFAAFVVSCLILLIPAEAAQHAPRNAKKPQLPPLPTGSTGPLPQIPLELIAPVPPQVSYENGQLTIVASNSTLADILRAVHNQTGIEIDTATANERVVTQLGPGPARSVLGELLTGSRFDYILLGSAVDADTVTRIVLIEKSPATIPSSEVQHAATPEAPIRQGASARSQQPEPTAPVSPEMQISQQPASNQEVTGPPEKPTGILESDEQQ